MLTGNTRKGSRIKTAPAQKVCNFLVQSITFINVFAAYQWKNKLRYVRIYFETPTFDTITMDRAAKFMDMLSAIGGTMGLLTGFSIISAMEIGYFAIKIVTNITRRKIRSI